MKNKTEAYQTLNLETGASEAEIKKVYRKLSLQHHPEKNDNSAESQRKFAEIQEAYQILSEEWPIKKYVGFSEEEIKEVAEELVEEFRVIEAKAKVLDPYSLWSIESAKRCFSWSIKSVKNYFSWAKAESNDILFYSTLEENQIQKNWLNHLFLLHSLDPQKNKNEISSFNEKLNDSLKRVETKKEVWEKIQQEHENIFSEPEWAELLKKLRETKGALDFYTDTWRKAAVKKLKKEIEESYDPSLLTDIINVEMSMWNSTPPYRAGEDYWKDLLYEENKALSQIRLFEIESILTNYNYKAKLIKEKSFRYYEVLELPEDATLEEVKASYKKLATEKHPDKEKNPKLKADKKKHFKL